VTGGRAPTARYRTGVTTPPGDRAGAPRGGEIAQTLDRGLRLLALVADTAARSGGVSVSDAATELGLARTVVHRLASTLVAHGLIRRDGQGRLHLGLGVLPLARAAQPLISGTALPALRRLAEDLGATAHLTVVDAGEALAILVVEPSWTAVHVAYRAGSRHPLERGAAGLAILAGRRGEARWATSTGELQSGAHGVAAPILGIEALEASIGVVSLTPLDPDTSGPRVLAAAREVAAALAG
jgi:DNA-binding IclR family transcriptional regulator